MAFDSIWFDELRKLDEIEISKVTHPRGFRPAMDELYHAGVISQNFIIQTLNLVRALHKTRYPFDRQFVAYERHITNFPKGRAFRKQWNIGFTGGDAPEEDYIRIGIGFRLGLLGEESGQKGVDDYLDYKQRIIKNPSTFDHTFNLLGKFTEPENLASSSSLAQSFLSDKPNFNDDWRFFGKKLKFSNPEDRQKMLVIDELVKEAIRVFDHITKCGFD
jgi:hypothetical protein